MKITERAKVARGILIDELMKAGATVDDINVWLSDEEALARINWACQLITDPTVAVEVINGQHLPS